MEQKPESKSLRRRLIAYGICAGLVLLLFVLRLAQVQLGLF